MITHGNQRETTLAYLAGILDGEGYFGIFENRPGYYTVAIKCNMCEPEAVRLLKAEFGGSLKLRVQAKKHWRPFYSWQLYGRKQIARMLTVILPYLRIKRELGNTLLEYTKLSGVDRHKVSTSELTRRQELYRKAKELIRRVPATTKPTDPERGSDSLNFGETQREQPEVVAPLSTILH